MTRWAQIVETCCRDLRRYFEHALKTTHGGVITVKMRRLLKVELSTPDRARYSTCLSRVLRRYKWKRDTYVIPRQDVEKLLEVLDSLCASLKTAEKKEEAQPRRRRLGEEAVLIAVSLPDDLLRAVDEYARAHNLTRSEVVRRAVQELIDMRRALEEIDKARIGELERVALRLPTDLLSAVNRYAAALKTTRSAVVRYAVMQMLTRQKEQQALA
jgi:metal-responsive CopG/Arc/MetJ family transcriptional regulator